MAGKTLQYFNLTGGLNTVQTMATINTTPKRTESPEMVNVEYFKLSGIRTMNGNVALNSGNSIGGKIEFGYEYVKGNDRYMIVADNQNLYEYNPTIDTFTKLTLSGDDNDTTFPFGHDTDTYITICGYANGIVAACPNSKNTYLVYYRKGRTAKRGEVSTTQGSNTVTVTSYSSNNYTCTEDIFGKGDIVIIGTRRYEVDTVQPAEIEDTSNPGTYITNPDKDKFTTVENVLDTLTDTDLYISDFTKIYCEAKYDVQYSGITITTFTPRVIHSHQGRLWVAAKPENYDTTAVVIYSDLGSIHNAFEGGDQSVYDGGYFEEFWEDTSDITALGSWDKYVVVHKREHTYLINTSNSDATTWNVESYSEYTCDNQRGYVKANNGYYVYSTSGGGIYPMIQRTIYSAISQGGEASTKIRDIFVNLNQYRLDEIFAVYHPTKKYIMFYLPMIGENGSKDCYILDLQTKTWLHRKVPQDVTCAFEFDNKVYIGTEDGKVLEEFRGYTFDGEPILFSWKSPWFIWGGATNFTTTREMRIKISQEGTNNFFIRNRRDGIEDYKERKISNSTTATNFLVWDDKILTLDISDGYTATVPVYYYNDGTTNYYSLESVLSPESMVFTFDRTPLQEDINSMNYLSNGSVAGTIVDDFDEWDGVAADATNADKIVPGTNPVYGYTWKGAEPSYKCYLREGDNNIKIWVNTNNTTQGSINLRQKQSTSMYAFYGVNINGTINTSVIIGVNNADYLNQLVNGTTNPIPMFIYSNGIWTRQYTVGTRTCYLWGGLGGSQGQTLIPLYGVSGCYTDAYNQTEMLGTTLAGGSRSSSLDAARRLLLPRASQYDTDGSNIWEWNGSTTRKGSVDISGTFTYNSTTDTVSYGGLQYNRYTPGDEGTQSSGQSETVYSDKAELRVGDTVYTQSDLQTEYGTVEVVNDTEYTINAKVFTPDADATDYGEDAEYYFIRPILYNLYNTSGTLYGLSLQRYYPTETVGDSEKVLTDSKWDGNDEIDLEINGRTYHYDASKDDPNQYYTKPNTQSSWVNTGQITKRFPLDRQYFQTLQIEFCGEGNNQGIELYGFEIDGIQLTEVPW